MGVWRLLDQKFLVFKPRFDSVYKTLNRIGGSGVDVKFHVVSLMMLPGCQLRACLIVGFGGRRRF